MDTSAIKGHARLVDNIIDTSNIHFEKIDKKGWDDAKRKRWATFFTKWSSFRKAWKVYYKDIMGDWWLGENDLITINSWNNTSQVWIAKSKPYLKADKIKELDEQIKDRKEKIIATEAIIDKDRIPWNKVLLVVGVGAAAVLAWKLIPNKETPRTVYIPERPYRYATNWGDEDDE